MLKLNIDCNYQFVPSEIKDLTDMANECAVKGWYVAQSRSIVNAVSGSELYYADNCEDANENSRIASKQSSHELSTSFNLFPNPNNGVMTLSYNLGKDKVADLNLYDVTGKLISIYNLQNTVGNLEINEAALHNGIYFYRILVNSKIIHTNKIVIIK